MKNMLSEALCVIRGLLNQLFVNLEGEQGEEWLQEFKKFLRKEKCWVKENILEFINTITISILAGEFIVRDHFKLDTDDGAEVRISYLGGNFKEWFLAKTESQAGGESTLRIHKLTKASVDGPIINELGVEAKAEIALAEVFALMKKQGKGEKGALLINGWANVSYIRDINGVLRAVDVYWLGGGWDVSARSVACPYEWGAGRRILSRNS